MRSAMHDESPSGRRQLDVGEGSVGPPQRFALQVGIRAVDAEDEIVVGVLSNADYGIEVDVEEDPHRQKATSVPRQVARRFRDELLLLGVEALIDVNIEHDAGNDASRSLRHL